MIRGLYARPGEMAVPVDTPSEMAQRIREGRGCLWADFQDASDAERQVLTSVFGLHELAVQQCTVSTNHPRLHEYGEYLAMVFHAVKGVLPLRTEEIDVFLGAGFLVTHHRGPVPEIEAVRKRAVEVGAVLHRGADRVLAELLDELADGATASLERLDSVVDGLEDRLFKFASRGALKETFALKKDVLHLRRLVSPQREVLNRLSRGEFKLVSADDVLLFRDVHDRILRVSETVESLRDMLSSAMEIYLTAVSNRTNEIMKVLTIVSILLMSVTFVAGLYGMNVPLPFDKTEGVFWKLVGMMMLVAGSLLLVFRVRRWI